MENTLCHARRRRSMNNKLLSKHKNPTNKNRQLELFRRGLRELASIYLTALFVYIVDNKRILSQPATQRLHICWSTSGLAFITVKIHISTSACRARISPAGMSRMLFGAPWSVIDSCEILSSSVCAKKRGCHASMGILRALSIVRRRDLEYPWNSVCGTSYSHVTL